MNHQNKSRTRTQFWIIQLGAFPGVVSFAMIQIAMSDDDNQFKQPPIEVPEDIRSVLTQFANALTTPVREVSRRSYQEGYKDGWHAAIEAVSKAILGIKDADIVPDPKMEPKIEVKISTEPDLREDEMQPERGSIPDIVFEMIGERPGLSGVELVNYAKDRRTPIHERSLRTALRRLRIARKIFRVEGKWYQQKDAPKSSELLSGGIYFNGDEEEDG